MPVFVVYDSSDRSIADLDDVLGDVSWERGVEHQPEVIALHDCAGAGSVEEKKKFGPVLRGLSSG